MGASAEKVVREKWCLLQATMDERASTVVRHGGGRDRLGRRGRSCARNRHGDQHGAQGARRGSQRCDARGCSQGSAQRRQTTVRGRTFRGVAGVRESYRSDHALRTVIRIHSSPMLVYGLAVVLAGWSTKASLVLYAAVPLFFILPNPLLERRIGAATHTVSGDDSG